MRLNVSAWAIRNPIAPLVLFLVLVCSPRQLPRARGDEDSQGRPMRLNVSAWAIRNPIAPLVLFLVLVCSPR
ncbi:hypothetical protein CTI14_69655, partial [Methylobacterium radiotolerans]